MYNKEPKKEYGAKKAYGDKAEKGDYAGFGEKYDADMEDAMDDGGRRGRKFSNSNKKKSCRFTAGEEDAANISYKNPKFLSTFMTEHGKIVPRRVTGNCSFIQRLLTQEIKRARQLSLLGFTSIGPNSNY
jgi:small subunit ribosomal protein S18